LYAYSLASMDELQARIDYRAQFSGEKCFWYLQHKFNTILNNNLYGVFPEYMLIVAHALVFLKIDVMGIITTISSVGRVQTSMRQGETDKRIVTIHLLGLVAPILLNATTFSQIVLFHALFLCCFVGDVCPTCCSNLTLDVSLWSEWATSFPAEEIHRVGQDSPQVVIFVGTLVKSYLGMSLSGGPSCKWYINPDVPEAKKLMAR
jgi:replication factor A1